MFFVGTLMCFYSHYIFSQDMNIDTFTIYYSVVLSIAFCTFWYIKEDVTHCTCCEFSLPVCSETLLPLNMLTCHNLSRYVRCR